MPTYPSGTSDFILQAFATSGNVTDPPQTDSNNFVNWTNGYTANYELDLTTSNPQAHPVERQVQNYLFQQLTSNIMDWQQNGMPTWYSAMSTTPLTGYAYGALVKIYNSTASQWQVFRSLVANNTQNPLGIGQTQWELQLFNYQLIQSIMFPTGGTGGPSTQLITSAINFNTIGTGSWEFQTDALVTSSTNFPANAKAGVLESIQWSAGSGNTFSMQRFIDRVGNVFTRGASNTTWSAWTQVGAIVPLTDGSSTVNLVTANSPISAASDGQQFLVTIANTNTGAATFQPNGSIAALPVYGANHSALQGGELNAGYRATFQYSSAAGAYYLIWTAGSVQVANAAQGNHAVALNQLLNTGSPLALTTTNQAVGTSNTAAANTAFVQSAVANGLTLQVTAGVNTSSQTCVAGTHYVNQYSNGTVAWTLPASPTNGQVVGITDYGSNYASTVNPGSNNFLGIFGNFSGVLTLNAQNFSGTFKFVNNNGVTGWVIL